MTVIASSVYCSCSTYKLESTVVLLRRFYKRSCFYPVNPLALTGPMVLHDCDGENKDDVSVTYRDTPVYVVVVVVHVPIVKLIVMVMVIVMNNY